jgi:hypothetical protein
MPRVRSRDGRTLVSWGRVDDGMLEHEKWLRVEELGGWAECVAVWTACLLYANRQSTDGAVPITWLRRGTPLGPRALKAADVLVEAGLFERAEGGYRIHDFLEYNESKSRRLERRDATAKRVADHRAKRGGNNVTDSVTNDVSNSSPGPARPGPNPSDLEHHADLDQVAPPATPAPDPADPPLRRLRLAFERRWLAKRLANGMGLGTTWTGFGRHSELALERAHEFANDQPKLERSLDGFFATSEKFLISTRYPFKSWADNPDRWMATRSEPASNAAEILSRVPSLSQLSRTE